MKCLKPIILHEGLTVNCGYCRACRANYTSQWKLRLMYELDNWNDASFVTLTFSDDYLLAHHRSSELNKKDLQNFFKRLRFYMMDNIKYYAVGEYGSRTKRGHYHAIIFGVSPYIEAHREAVKCAWLPRCEDWQFDVSRGVKSAIAPVTPEDIAYVTGYVQKKLSGPLAEKEYGKAQRPFSLCSQGLGLDFALKNAERLRQNGYTYIQGKKIGLPRYFRDKLDINIEQRDCSTSTVARLRQEVNEMLEKFDLDCKNRGIEYTSLEMKARAFQRWYERFEWCYADAIYEQFQQRSKLHGGF